jgi:hypothetical protein
MSTISRGVVVELCYEAYGLRGMMFEECLKGGVGMRSGLCLVRNGVRGL